jgi:hypothetical protein
MSAHREEWAPPTAVAEVPRFARRMDPGNAMMINELIICVAVIAVVAAFAIDECRDRMTAARLVEPLQNAAILRGLWVEEHAVTGQAPYDSVAYSRGSQSGAPEGSLTRPESLGSVSGLEALRAKAAQAGDAGEQSAGKGEQGVANAIVGISDGVPMASVHRAGLVPPRLLEFRPALRQPDAPVVVWLCDGGPAPPGWSAPTARGPRIPVHLLPTACRKGLTP